MITHLCHVPIFNMSVFFVGNCTHIKAFKKRAKVACLIRVFMVFVGLEERRCKKDILLRRISWKEEKRLSAFFVLNL